MKRQKCPECGKPCMAACSQFWNGGRISQVWYYICTCGYRVPFMHHGDHLPNQRDLDRWAVEKFVDSLKEGK